MARCSKQIKETAVLFSNTSTSHTQALFLLMYIKLELIKIAHHHFLPTFVTSFFLFYYINEKDESKFNYQFKL
jgi:hypothetical protein